MRLLIFGRSVGLKEKKKRPGIPASLLWSPEKTRHEPKINMAEKLVDVFVKLRQRGKRSTTETLCCYYAHIFFFFFL